MIALHHFSGMLDALPGAQGEGTPMTHAYPVFAHDHQH